MNDFPANNTYWPLFNLAIRSEKLLLKIVNDELLYRLVDVARGGLHEKGLMTFDDNWSNFSEDKMIKHLLQWNWRARSNWNVNAWTASFAVIINEEVIGGASIYSRYYPLLKSFGVKLWIGKKYQGNGIGKEVFSLILHLGFEGLNGNEATANALACNIPSISVMKYLGFCDNGEVHRPIDNESVLRRSFRLSRTDWENRSPRIRAEIVGLDPCIHMFGV